MVLQVSCPVGSSGTVRLLCCTVAVLYDSEHVPPRMVPIFSVVPFTISPCTCAIPPPVDGFNVPVNDDAHPPQAAAPVAGGLTHVQLIHAQLDSEATNAFEQRLHILRRGPLTCLHLAHAQKCIGLCGTVRGRKRGREGTAVVPSYHEQKAEQRGAESV